MIKTAADFKTEYREHMRDGAGTVEVTPFVSGADLNEKGRLFGTIVLHPGCGIGFHIHEKDSELFYIMKGTAVYSDNGTETTVKAGDVAICPAGTGHSIHNNGTEDVELVALIVYA